MKAFFKKNWNYLIVMLIPWLIFILHLVITKLWFEGEGCILAGDAGTIYYTMYSELWDKIHNGGSLFFTWNAGGGSDFLVYVFRYMISPATLLIAALPKAWLAEALQFCMMAKWSLLMFTMLYFIMHTKHNRIEEHRRLSGILLTLGFGLSSAMIENLSRLSRYDSIIIFPILLLLSEDMQSGKRKLWFYIGLTACICCNFSIGIPVSIFIILWHVIQSDKLKGSLSLIICTLLSYLTSMVVIIPCVYASKNSRQLYPYESIADYFKTGMYSLTDFFHRWFIFDSKGISQTDQPMFYCSLTLLAVAFFYIFIKETAKKKIAVIVLTLLLIGGLVNGGLNMLWHGYLGADKEPNGFAFLLVFMVIYMSMCVLERLKDLKMIYTLPVAVCLLGGVVYAFFTAYILKNFYVYLATVLLLVLMVMLIFFYCKKSIKHRNMYIVISVFALLELFANANVQFLEYAVYGVDTMCYRQAKEVLANKIKLNPGERVVVPQDAANYNMVCGLPAVAGELPYTDSDMHNLARQLGIGWDDDLYTYSGASPLINLMFNVKYGMSYGAGDDCQAFSDEEKLGENSNARLYEFSRIAGIGYMTGDDICNWNPDNLSPFVAQNEFVKRASGVGDIFTIITPEDAGVKATFPQDPRDNIYQVGVATHGVEKEYGGFYDEETGELVYYYSNGYYGEYITFEFESDGETDYYVYVGSTSSISCACGIDDDILYYDAIPAKERTYHIGVVEKGKKIKLMSSAEIDSDDMSVQTMKYQIAGFSEENYRQAYEKFSRNVYNVDTWKDNLVSGTIDAEEKGVMMTGIPALPGFKVYVDGEQTECERIGNALIGVPLGKGTHKVEFVYKTPYFIF